MNNTLSRTIKQIIAERSNDYTFLEKEYIKLTNTSLSLDPDASPVYMPSSKPLTVSIVIPAYNVSSSILSCLASIEQSSFNLYHQNQLQVVVVDDGSTDDTWEKIKQSRLAMHLTALRQDNHGQAKALNTGISIAEGDIIISCDADMILSYYTIEHFVVRHQQLPDVLLTGFRTNTTINDRVVNYRWINENGSHRNPCFTGDERIHFPISGWPDNMCVSSEHFKRLGYARGLWMPDGSEPWLLSDLVIGALFSLSKSVYLNIGGYDERFIGWGCTDGYLAVKAIAAGQYIVPVYAASGLHINHPSRSANKLLEYKRNRALFFNLIQESKIGHQQNWLLHAKDRIIESFVRSPIYASAMLPRKNLVRQEAETVLNKIDCLLAIGEYSQAYIILINSKSQYKDNVQLGKALIGMKRYKEAIDVFKEVSRGSNLSSKVMINLAIAQAANGQFLSANRTLKTLSQINSQNPDLSYWYFGTVEEHIQQGIKYLNQEFYNVATRCFEAALIIDSSNKTAFKYRTGCINKA